MSTHESSEKKHSSFGDKIKGAAHIVHGIGEDIRGSVMGAFESASGSAEAKSKDEDIAAKGKDEIQQGVAQMKGLGTTAGPESHAEGKTGDQPQEQPATETAPGPTPAPPPSPTQSRLAEQETTRREPSGQTQAGTEEVQKGGQGTQAASEIKSPRTGDKGPTGAGIPGPQGVGSST